MLRRTAQRRTGQTGCRPRTGVVGGGDKAIPTKRAVFEVAPRFAGHQHEPGRRTVGQRVAVLPVQPARKTGRRGRGLQRQRQHQRTGRARVRNRGEQDLFGIRQGVKARRGRPRAPVRNFLVEPGKGGRVERLAGEHDGKNSANLGPLWQLKVAGALTGADVERIRRLLPDPRPGAQLDDRAPVGVLHRAVDFRIARLDRKLRPHLVQTIGVLDAEEKWVDIANRHVGAIPHKVLVSPEELARDLDDMIRAQGEPFGSTSIYAQYRVFQLAKETGVTVTLEGQGADEMLAGYSGYPGQRIRSLIETGCWRQAWQFLNSWSQWPGRSRFEGLHSIVAEMTDGVVYQTLHRLSGRRFIPNWIKANELAEHGVSLHYPRQRPELNRRGRRVVAQLAHSLSKRGIASLLRHGDRNSMRFSIESRVPFLTLEQVEFLLSLPEHYLIAQNGETKSVFRAAMRGIVPDEILDRKDKIGFQTPEQQWLVSMAGTVRRWLQTDIDLPFLNQQAIMYEFAAIADGRKQFTYQLWRWINFIRWHQRFL